MLNIETAEQLSSMLGGHQVSPGQFMALCPAHPDGNPSLSIGQGNGVVLVNCFAGCQYKEIVKALEERGINLATNGHEEIDWPTGVPASWNGKRYRARWAYRDKAGDPIGHVVRYESPSGEKEIIPFFKGDPFGWKSGYPKGQMRPLYNLDKISKLPPDHPVWVVEGEKCADALTELNCVATTSPGGSNGARLADWSPLAGRTVVIWPDKDRAGTVYAGNVFNTLMEVGDSNQEVILIEVDKMDALKTKEDAFDWIQKGFGAEDIEGLPNKLLMNLDDLQIIVVDEAQIFEAIDKTEVAFKRANPYAIFQRKSLMVRVAVAPNKAMTTAETKEEDYVGLREVKVEHLLDLWNRHLTFAKVDANGELAPIDPLAKMATRYMARENWNLNILSGVIYAPTLRPNGEPLERLGYDELSGLYFVDTGARFNPLKRGPTPEDAVKALSVLRYPLADFPFVEPEDESVALAAMLTSLVRNSLATAPMFAFTAPVAGSGKTLLANVVSIIATGKQAVPMPHGRDREEMRKALFAKLLMGSPIILIDNIEQIFSNDVVCAILTAPGSTWSDRILGESQIREVPTNVTFMATGNNLTFRGDITRRVLLCTIDPNMEKPEEREDFRIKEPLERHVQRHRAAYVEAGLTILKAYIRAGSPKQEIKQYGSFEGFSDWVRSALAWLGRADPVLTKKKVEEEDPGKQAFYRIIQAWSGEWQVKSISAAEITQDCNNALENHPADSPLYQMADALKEVTRSRGKSLDSASVGRVGNFVWESLNTAQEEGFQYILFRHGYSTSGPFQTTARSIVRGIMRSKESTPYIIKAKSLQHNAVFVVAVRPLKR
jgi:putative DNA primase/helicase